MKPFYLWVSYAARGVGVYGLYLFIPAPWSGLDDFFHGIRGEIWRDTAGYRGIPRDAGRYREMAQKNRPDQGFICVRDLRLASGESRDCGLELCVSHIALFPLQLPWACGHVVIKPQQHLKTQHSKTTK